MCSMMDSFARKTGASGGLWRIVFAAVNARGDGAEVSILLSVILGRLRKGKRESGQFIEAGLIVRSFCRKCPTGVSRLGDRIARNGGCAVKY